MRELTRRDFVRNSLVGGAAISAAPGLFGYTTEQPPQAPAHTPAVAATPVTGAAQDKYAYVDPELIPFLKTFTTLFFDQQVLAEERKHPASFPALPAPAPQPYERHIPGPAGAPDLRIVIVDPLPGAKNRPAFLNIHGGGYIAGFAGWNPPFIQTPMLDDRTGSTHPVPPHIGQFVWNATSNRFGWNSLLGVPAGPPTVPAGAVPARTENLSNLPAAFISVGSIDLFVDEDIEYARRLNNAGVPTELHVIPGAFHGYDLLAPDTNVSKRFTESWKVALIRAFNNR